MWWAIDAFFEDIYVTKNRSTVELFCVQFDHWLDTGIAHWEAMVSDPHYGPARRHIV